MKVNKYPDPEYLYNCAKNTDALIKVEAFIKNVYEPPITLYMNEIQTQIEDNCLKAVQSYGFNVDKDELKKALDYDRGQYDKGYADARKMYERLHGEWLDIYSSHIAYKCSCCERQMPITDFFNYCPNCGAYMRKAAENDSN